EAMKNVRHSQDFRSFEHRPAEQGKPLGIIRKIARGGAVEAISIKKWRIVHKIKAHARISRAGDDRAEPILIVEWNRDALHHHALFWNSRQAIAGNINADFMPGGGECAWQCAHHVRQAASFRKGNAFGSDERDVHVSGVSKQYTARARAMISATRDSRLRVTV